MKLDDLPKFKAEHTEIVGDDLFIYGTIDNLLPVLNGDETSWLLSSTTALIGDIAILHHETHAVVFKGFITDLPPELFDTGLSWMDTYYNATDVWHVLDETIEWETSTFHTRGGWDHEHCFICNGHIDEEEPLCYTFKSKDHGVFWSCPACYARWVSTHDIGFIYVGWTR